jgi:hypothetical protein
VDPLTAAAIWTADPAIEVANGTELRFAPAAFVLPFNEGFGAIRPEWAFFEGVVLTLTVRMDGLLTCHGTAVMVAPGVALCARHVVQPLLDAALAGTAALLCAGIRSDGLQLWVVKHITMVDENDVVILGLVGASKIPENQTYFHAVIDAQLPKPGDNVRMFGFVHSARPEATEITGSLMASQGKVIERHDDKRDSVFIRWPVYAVACNSVGGMSGGPVFDEQGHLIGLLCSSFTCDDETGPSYVSALWPVLAQRYLGGWPESLFEGHHTLHSLADEMAMPTLEIRNKQLIEAVIIDGITSTRYRVSTSA